jgi:DNA modification methylase
VRTKGNWTGDRKQTTLWSIPAGGQDAETVHSTQKPVECMRRPMLNNSSPGQAVYEPFLGSGTTLIAAQTSGRVCFGMELEPRFVDVAVRRWQAFTGQAATLLGNSGCFDGVAQERRTIEQVDLGRPLTADREAIATITSAIAEDA